MKDYYDLAQQYAQTIIDSDDFRELLVLKEHIKKELSLKIIAFKTAEAKYLDAKQYGKYHPDLKKYQTLFLEKKKALYEEPMIMKYKSLERKIQYRLDTDFDDLKKSISNKYHLSKSILI